MCTNPNKIQPEEVDMAKTGLVVTLHNVEYAIPKKKSRKVILEKISCKFPCGLNAILGPTGSGKTSLLDIMSGRKDQKGQSGSVLVDGQPRPDNFRGSVGYVVQDDVVCGLLTVKENIAFSANLRLDKKMSQKEKKKLVDSTLLQLGLMHCADSLVGTMYIRGVSGGERKRTNIGMELVIAPKILFLDEPTTGLDASTANALLLILKNLACQGHMIIFTIHQPRYSIFKLFDQMTLLSLGKLVYHGPANQSLAYFDSIGHTCEEHNNPPDFFLDIINCDSTAVQDGQVVATPAADYDVESSTHGSQLELQVSVAKDLEDHFKESGLCQEKELFELYKDHTKNAPSISSKVSNQASFLSQVKHVSKRIMLNNFRNPETYITQICVVIVFALLTGGIYFQLDDSITQGIPNRAGAVFFIVMNQIFQNLSAIDIFIRERALFIHENSAGFYGCFAYFISKLLCDIVPMRLQPVLLFSVISYFMIGFQIDVVKFFLFVLTLFLTTVGAAAVGFFVSATISISAIANLIVALIFVFMMVFSGFLVKLTTVGWWVRWVSYISIFRYSMNALLINEMENMSFCETINVTTFCDPQAGNDFLRDQEIDYGTNWDFWKNEMALFIISFMLIILSYIQLRLIKKTT